MVSKIQVFHHSPKTRVCHKVLCEMLAIAFQGISFWHQKSISKSCFSRHLRGLDFKLILYENGRFGDPFKMQWAPTWDPKSTKWRQGTQKKHRCSSCWGVQEVTRETLKHAERPRGLDLGFFIVFHCWFCVFTFQFERYNNYNSKKEEQEF